MNKPSSYRYALWLLTLLFGLRVAGQVLQRWFPSSLLPPFSAFQGSTLPYSVLLSAQLVILAFMLSAAWRVQQGTLVPRAGVAVFLGWFAAIYLTGSILRILIGALYPDAAPWFTAWIPAFFHLVLASFVAIMALCYRETPLRQGWRYAIYPASVTAAFALFALLRKMEVALLLALYLSIIANALWILLLERALPAREDWRPKWKDVKSDAAFIALVQVALPRMLTMGVALVLASLAHERLPAAGWPHHWHWTAQTLLMILIVDFLRYWLHRACHHFPALWRLHVVHHSPRLLYSLNTSRFHPLEKVLHFSLDTVPFLLLGLSPEVLAGYFLVYAVNGFYQHSNIQMHYGLLNYVVGSAETHRWHHARDPKTASCNFSSTLLIWDLVFGTWYLPKERTLGQIGILDDTYPMGFWRQMSAPFR